ncbi:DUF6886 family protein [Kineococcus sp. DHX-1]|uniref:DUF6886 family protein n=1 Tax=Kineococcus sp. DHX-1 TaxID=3349638 RepID=UPI0036D36CBB
MFHVTDAGPLSSMSPRPSPPGTAYEGRPWVWALDEEHLPHYLLPRQCPRVCWRAGDLTHRLLGSTSSRVVAIEHRWAHQLLHAGLDVHELQPTGFTVLDEHAGYWVADQKVLVLDVRHVEDCSGALAEHDVELRLVSSLWPLMDAVIEHASEYSGIRLRNAAPRPA